LAERPARGVRESDGPAATEALGAEVAAGLSPGDVVLVSGELGAGKTTFVRGASRALGVEGPITSPTFTIGRRYRGDVSVAHVDLYRLLDSPASLATEVARLGLRERRRRARLHSSSSRPSCATSTPPAASDRAVGSAVSPAPTTSTAPAGRPSGLRYSLVCRAGTGSRGRAE